MKNWEPKGVGELIEVPQAPVATRPRGLVVMHAHHHFGVVRHPVGAGPLTFDVYPSTRVGPVMGAKQMSPDAMYELLHGREFESVWESTIAIVLAYYFAGSLESRYANRLLAWAYCVVAASLGKREGLDITINTAHWAGVMGRTLSRYISDDLARLSDEERASVQAAAPWIFEFSAKLHASYAEDPFDFDPKDSLPWVTTMCRVRERREVFCNVASKIEDASEKLRALKALWPSVADFVAAREAATWPVPVLGDVLTLGGKDVVVIDKIQWGTNIPNFFVTQRVECAGVSLAISLSEIDAQTPRRRVTPEEWERLLLENCQTPDTHWQVAYLCEEYGKKADFPQAQLALFLLAYGRLYSGSTRGKNIAKKLQAALKECTEDERTWLCERYPEAAALVRTRTKPDALKWTYDWAPALKAAVDWGKPPEPKIAEPEPERAAPTPGRMNPKLQGLGQIRARANAAPTGVAHRLLESEWDARGDAIPELMDMTFRWLEDKLGIALTDHWRTGNHEFEHHGFRLETERLTGLFAFRIEHPDGRVSGRRWRVEGTLIEPTTPDSTGAASIRLTAIDQFKSMERPPYSMPGLAQRWMTTGALTIVNRDPREVWGVETHQDFFTFRNTAIDANRPVGFIVTAGECPDIPAQLVGTVVHVHLAPALVGDYAKRFGTVPRAREVHLFAAKSAEPLAMPFAERWQMEKAVRAATRTSRLPSFGDIRQQVRVAQLETARRQSAAAAAAPGESAAAVEAVPVAMAEQDTSQMMDLALADLDRANEALAAAEYALAERQDALRDAHHQIRALKMRLGEVLETEPVDEQLPDDFAMLPRFARLMRPRLIIAPKALRSAQDAEDFQDKQLVFKTLQALATHYWDMRFGDRDVGREGWTQFLKDNRLNFGPVGHALDNQRFSDAYKVSLDGESLPLDLHVQGSSARDPSRCLRVYLHADERRQRIVVGHLPTHLPNTHS